MTYRENPLIHRDRRLAGAESAWVRSFAVEDVKPLIVCRGPIRKEAIDVFREMGMTQVGILVSEKDSIVYPGALAPELRDLDHEHVHFVEDYSGATKDEREARMAEIVAICRREGYDSVFAGYGFMAEDDTFVRYLEDAGLRFLGPNSGTQQAAGKKDEAKRTALAEDVSVTPGVDDLTTRTLLAKHGDLEALRKVASERGLELAPKALEGGLEAAAQAVLVASYAKGLDPFTIDELCAQLQAEVEALLRMHPGKRVRLKAIGGGGGKGQRILAADLLEGESQADAAKRIAATAPEKGREVLAEVKATGVGDDKNMLIELNIEQTRHNEIQLLGNGSWCVSLGGRDCSLQMHEQKLLEVSITREGLDAAIAAAEAAGRGSEAEVLKADRAALVRMEEEGCRFGRAVGLNSASTFECIVEGDRHYFMEVNTRIQVEHRVSELCYALRFENPDDASDHFVVESLVEAMALCARHGERLPEPKLQAREGAALEARLNATNDALRPHAGGKIISWSEPLPYEVRDDQGICMRNPDTGEFVHYLLAGAYDSNVALLVTAGGDREESFARLQEILRAAKIRGHDLATNLDFHYGLVSWLRGWSVWAKPTTRFVVPYLTQVGLVGDAARKVEVLYAYMALAARDAKVAGSKQAAKAVNDAYKRKATLLMRPLQQLLDSPHVLSGWLANFRGRVRYEGGRLSWRDNPLAVLRDTYHFLNMERWEGAAPAYVIWRHDEELLDLGLAVYATLEERLGLDWEALATRLEEASPPEGFDPETWGRVRAAHRGHMLGLEVLGLAYLVGEQVGFFELRLDERLEVQIPERLLDPELQAAMGRVLAPPPATRDDAIVAATGGMFYAQEAPGKPPFISEGDHFDKGQPLYIIEVMKMFNRVAAPFAGTVDKVIIPGGDGVIVKKGQPLFEVRPDEKIVDRDPKEVAAERRAATDALLAALL